jgi:hypothetical protein
MDDTFRFPWTWFGEFIGPRADRRALLSELLSGSALGCSEIVIAGNRHFFVSPDRERSPGGRNGPGPASTILAAHYDRVQGSPGANDNSAAVFLLLETALKLREGRIRDWLMVFTDKEELGSGEGLTDQGSYSLARSLKNAGLGTARIFSFDACGAGDTLVISTAADELLKTEEGAGIRRARKRVRELREAALEAARNLGLDKVLLLPTPFSDDAGFLRGGIAAQTITVLPQEEAFRFATLIRRRPGFGRALLSREQMEGRDLSLIPETWRTLNGPEDSRLRLTPRHYHRIVRFAAALCGG